MVMMQVAHIVVLGLLVVSAVMVFALKDLMHSAIALAAFSFILSIEFFLLQAPDVAMAEAAIGAGLSTAIYIIAIRATSRRGGDETV